MPNDDAPKILDELAEGTPDELQRDVAAAIRREREKNADPKQDGAHPSFQHERARQAEIERIWTTFWLPSLRGEDGKVSLEKLKGELYDCHHLIMAAPQVYHHVTGGVTDDPTASAEAIIRLAEKRFAERLRLSMEGRPDAPASIVGKLREKRRDDVIKAAKELARALDSEMVPEIGASPQEAHDALWAALNALEE